MLLFIVFVVIVAIWVWPFVWFRLIKESLQLEVKVNRHMVEIGDEIQLDCKIQNNSWLACPSFLLSIDLPEGLEAANQRGLRLLRLNTNLRAHESITCHAHCKATRRGFQTFANLPAVLVLSEGFGLKKLVVKRQITDDVSVFPATVHTDGQIIQLKTIIGDIETHRWIHPDESMLKGIREYQTGDAFKQIAWNASASSGRWMAKQFSSSTEAKVHLILNAQFHESTWYGTRGDEFDSLCSLLHNTAEMLSSRGFQLQFSSNAVFPNDPTLHQHGLQSAAGMRLLLARLQPYTNLDFTDLWVESLSRTEQDCQVVLFTSYLSDKHENQIEEARQFVDVTVVPGPDPDFNLERLSAQRAL